MRLVQRLTYFSRGAGVVGQSIPRPEYTWGIIWPRVRVSVSASVRVRVRVKVSVGRPDYTRG